MEKSRKNFSEFVDRLLLGAAFGTFSGLIAFFCDSQGSAVIAMAIGLVIGALTAFLPKSWFEVIWSLLWW